MLEDPKEVLTDKGAEQKMAERTKPCRYGDSVLHTVKMQVINLAPCFRIALPADALSGTRIGGRI